MLFLLLTGLFHSFVWADSPGKTSVTIEELCSYDRMCTSALNGDKTVKAPNKALLRLLEEHAEYVYQYSRKFGVDPRAVMGAILAENTMNVGIEDQVQGWLANMGISGVGSKKFSFGLGQINLDAALSAEPFAAKKDNRKPRSSQEIMNKLVTPEGSIEYAAAIILEAQETYSEVAKRDISKNIGALTTLYNLGKIRSRAEDSKTRNLAPKPNYFGYFVEANLPTIEKILERAKAARDFDIVAATADKKRLKLESTATLFSGVPSCGAVMDYYSQGGKLYDYKKKSLQVNYPENAKAQGEYEILNRNIDCDAQDWLLIRDSSGNTGWAKREILQSKSALITAGPDANCTENSDCKNELGKLSSPKWKETDKRHLWRAFVSIPGDSKDVEPNWKADLQSCLGYVNVTNLGTNSAQAAGGSGNQNSNGGLPQGWQKLTPEENIKIFRQIMGKRNEIADFLGLSGWDDPVNPLAQQLGNFSNFNYYLSFCKFRDCYTDRMKEIQAFLKKDVKSYTSIGEIARMGSAVYISSTLPGSNFSGSFTNAELMQHFQRKCGPWKSQQDPKIQDMMRRIENNIPLLPSMQIWNAMFDYIEDGCGGASAVAAYLKPDGVNSDNFETVCSQRIASMSGFTSLALMEKFGEEITIELQKQTLSLNLSNLDNMLSQYANQKNQPDNSTKLQSNVCAYDPEQTHKVIEQLAQLPCVSHIIVPDVFLYNQSEQKEKIIYSSNETITDSYSVVFRSECGGEGK